MANIATVLCTIPVLALLPTGSFGVTLYAEKENVMRREPSSRSVHLNSAGAVIQESETKISHNRVGVDLCDTDFIMGTQDTNDCTPAPEDARGGAVAGGGGAGNDTAAASALQSSWLYNHTLVLEESMCMEAGRRSHAATSASTFHLGLLWEGKHPKGCFKFGCNTSDNGICYYYNAVGEYPKGPVKGTPVCSRPMHLNGTKNQNGGCPTGYEVIDGPSKVFDGKAVTSEDACDAVARCWSRCVVATHFRIGEHNASKHLDYPKGCFINEEDGCVYFNNIPESMGEGTKVTGTPICRVSDVVQWPTPAPPALSNGTDAGAGGPPAADGTPPAAGDTPAAGGS